MFPSHDRGVTTGNGAVNFNVVPHMIVPKNADVRVRAVADTNGTEVHAGFHGYIAIVV